MPLMESLSAEQMLMLVPNFEFAGVVQPDVKFHAHEGLIGDYLEGEETIYF